MMNKQISQVPPRPRDQLPDLPETVERVILKCLAKKPADRPATARNVYNALLEMAATARIASVTQSAA